MVRCPSARRRGTQRDAEGAARRQGAAADRCLGLRRQGRARPDRARAARHDASPSCCAATPQQRLAERGADQRARSRASTAARVRAISGDLGDDGLERRRRHRRRHPLRRLGLLRAVARRGARAQRQGPDAPARTRVRDAGSDPYFIHVSTAYAAGQRTGLVLEKPSGTAPTRAVAGPQRRARRRARRGAATSRPSRACPVHQHRFVKEAAARRRPGRRPRDRHARRDAALRLGPRPAHRARPRARPRARLVRTPTRSRKAIGERTLIAANPRQLTIVRPAIVESALHTPYPGWMESLKVADPILLGYGAGHHPRPLRRQPLDPDGPDPGRLRRQRLPRRRRDPAGGRHRAHDERVHGHAQPVHDPRHGRDHHAATSASGRSRTRTACRSTCPSGGCRRAARS